MSLDPFWKFSLPSYSSDITKQLSTFHLPPCGGDENVLAKDLKQWPILVFIWLFSQYCTRIAVFGKSFPLHHVSRSKTTSLAYYFHSNITNVNATYSHQRPPSVGMPRHALRRRMPNSATWRPQFPLGGHEYTLPEYLRGGGGAPSPSLLSDFYLEWGVQKNSDFGIEPYDLNETLCVGRS